MPQNAKPMINGVIDTHLWKFYCWCSKCQ